MPRNPRVYADLLESKIAQHGTPVWLINTGWVGGGLKDGKRISLTYSRAIVRAILNGSLEKQEFVTETAFGLAVPKACEGVPSGLLMPRENWADSNAYDAAAAQLNTLFEDNAKTFKPKWAKGFAIAKPFACALIPPICPHACAKATVPNHMMPLPI